MLLAKNLHVLVNDLARPIVSEEVTDHALLAFHRCEEFLLVRNEVVFAMSLLQPCLLLVCLSLHLLHTHQRAQEGPAMGMRPAM